jgi:Raf kinase inhibitor-like YbhB/YbcL family protein
MAAMRLAGLMLVAGTLLAGCGGSAKTPPAASLKLGGLALSSPAFAGGKLARAVTCDGAARSPLIRIGKVPAAAVELVLVLTDPDAPGGRYTHWAVAHIPASTTEIPSGGVPAGAVVALNDKGERVYDPPCPPTGDGAHRYQLVVYALGKPSGIGGGANPQKVGEQLGKQPILAGGVLEARYGR